MRFMWYRFVRLVHSAGDRLVSTVLGTESAERGKGLAFAATRSAMGAGDQAAGQEKSMQTVAILCAARNSVYKTLRAVDVYDEQRDARTFPGGMPVVAHPPCRLWSAFCRHQAKSPDPETEMDLGLWCVEQVQRCGGVLEQPAHSGLFEMAGVVPTVTLCQSDWGHTEIKATWLYVRGCGGQFPPLPRLRGVAGSRRKWQRKSKNQRSATPPDFAHWLVDLARMCSPAQEVLR